MILSAPTIRFFSNNLRDVTKNAYNNNICKFNQDIRPRIYKLDHRSGVAVAVIAIVYLQTALFNSDSCN